MFKRVGLYSGIALLTLLFLGYIFRLALFQWLVTPQLNKLGVSISCVNFSVTKKFDLYLERGCFSYDNHELIVSGVTINSREIRVEQALLKLADNNLENKPQTQSATKLNIALAEERPKVRIKKLQLQAEFLSQPLQLSVVETQLNQLHVTGDINASVMLQGDKILLSSQLTDSQLKPFINHGEGITGLEFSGQPHISFDGINVKLHAAIKAHYLYQYDTCPITINSEGEIALQYNLNSRAAQLDMSQLSNDVVTAADCLEQNAANEYIGFAIEQLPSHWQLHFANIISWQDNQIKLPLLELTGSSVIPQTQLTLRDIQFDVTQPLYSLQLQATATMASKAVDLLTVHGTLRNEQLNAEYDLGLASLPEFMPISISQLKAAGKFSLAPWQGVDGIHQIQGTMDVADAEVFGAKISGYSARLSADKMQNNRINVTLISDIKALKYTDYRFENSQNTLTVSSNIAAGELFADMTAETKIARITSPQLNLKQLNISSKGLQGRALSASHHAFINGIELVATQHISAAEHSFELVVPPQNINKLTPILQQFEPLIQLTQGQFHGRMSGDIMLQQANWYAELSDVSALYNDYLLSQFNTKLDGSYNSGQLNISPASFTINQFRAGAVVNDIKGQLVAVNNLVSLSDIEGEVFDGELELDGYVIGQPKQLSELTLNNIDISELIALDEKSGITITGRMQGQLPIHFSAEGVEIIAGSIASQGAGKLLITDNAAFDAVMQQQPSLQPVLSLLTDLDIQQFNSSVALKPDGWLDLAVNLQGFNEVKQQPVNFNYNHQENVFTLLRALRLSDEITQKVEQQYSEKGH